MLDGGLIYSEEKIESELTNAPSTNHIMEVRVIVLNGTRKGVGSKL